MKLLRVLLSFALVFAFCPMAYADDVVGDTAEGSAGSSASGGLAGNDQFAFDPNASGSANETDSAIDDGVFSAEVDCDSSDIEADVVEGEASSVIDIEDDGTENAENPGGLDALAAQHAGNLVDGDYVICSGVGSRQVLDVKSASTANKANVQTYLSNGTNAQVWAVSHDDIGYITLTCAASGKTLDVAGGKTASGTNVWQYASNDTTAQKWVAVPQGNGFKLVSALDASMCLDVAGAKAASGTNVQIYVDNGTTAQTFTFVPANPKVATCEDLGLGGWYEVASCLDGSYVLDVKSASVADGANVQLYSSNGTFAQLFGFEYDESCGYYRIVSAVSGKYLEVAGGDPVEGANVRQWALRSDDACQLFSIVKSEGENGKTTYSFINVASGLALSVEGASATNSANVSGAKLVDSTAQRFNLVENVSLLSDGVYTISSALSSSKVLDVKSASIADGANVQIYSSNSTLAQKWWVSAVADETNVYRIQSLGSGLYLTADDSGNVCQRVSSGGENQQWRVVLSAGQLVLGNMASGKVLDVASAKTANGTNVQTYAPNGTDAQKFTFKSVCPIANGTYVMHLASSSGYVLDVASGSSANGANIQLYASNNTGAQKWKVSKNSDETYTFLNAANNKALDVKSASAIEGANVQQYASNSTAAQKWKIAWDPNAASFVVTSALNSSLVLGAASSAANGANVQLCSSDSDASLQRWTFEATTHTALSYDQQAMYNKAQGYSSVTKWLILVNSKTNKVGIFYGSKGNWELKYYWNCSTGASSSPTVTGQYTVGIKGYSFGSGYTCYYYTQFYGNYLFHSVLYYQGTKTIMDGTLGKNVSHGCVRLPINNAKWIYDNIPKGTKVVSYR